MVDFTEYNGLEVVSNYINSKVISPIQPKTYILLKFLLQLEALIPTQLTNLETE